MFKKLMVVSLVLAAVVAGAGSALSGGSARPALVKPEPVNPSLQSRFDDRSGLRLYRLGDTGMWME